MIIAAGSPAEQDPAYDQLGFFKKDGDSLWLSVRGGGDCFALKRLTLYPCALPVSRSR